MSYTSVSGGAKFLPILILTFGLLPPVYFFRLRLDIRNDWTFFSSILATNTNEEASEKLKKELEEHDVLSSRVGDDTNNDNAVDRYHSYIT